MPSLCKRCRLARVCLEAYAGEVHRAESGAPHGVAAIAGLPEEPACLDIVFRRTHAASNTREVRSRMCFVGS